MSGGVRTDDPATLRKQLEEVLDECVYAERQTDEVRRQLDNERRRSGSAVSALEELLGYLALLESQIILPALGPLVTTLAQHKEAAERRARGESLVVSVVNAETNPRLSRALAAMRAPSSEVQQEAERSKALSSRAGVPLVTAAEDGYVLLANLLKEKNALLGVLRNVGSALSNAGSSSGTIAATSVSGSPVRRSAGVADVSSPPLGSLRAAVGGGGVTSSSSSIQRASRTAISPGDDVNVMAERLAAENRALQQELSLLQSSCDARIVAADRDRELIQVKLDDALRQLRDAERDRDAARNRAHGADSVDQLYQQSIVERRLLEDRLLQLEEQIKQNDSDKALVAQKFAVLQRALEQAQTQQHHDTIYGGGAGGGFPSSSSSSTPRIVGAPAGSASVSWGGLNASSPIVGGGADRNDDAVYRQMQSEAARLRAELDQSRAAMREREIKFEKELFLMRKKLGAGAGGTIGNGPRGGAAVPDDATVTVAADGTITLKPPTSAVDGHHDVSSGGGGIPPAASQAKLRALELTVQALNSELASLEDKILTIEYQFAEEKAMLLNQMEAERQRAEREQHDADGVLSELSRELSAAMAENTQLKARIKGLLSSGSGRGPSVPAGDS